MSKKHNFGAGPCILPQDVFAEAAKAVTDFNGLSILEVSHRSPDFVAVMDEAQALVKKALNVPEGYSVLFIQGGASLGFLISAMNMAGKHKKCAYVSENVEMCLHNNVPACRQKSRDCIFPPCCALVLSDLNRKFRPTRYCKLLADPLMYMAYSELQRQ